MTDPNYMKLVDGERIFMTDAEIAERQTEEAAWAAGAPTRDAEQALRALDASLPRVAEDIIAATVADTTKLPVVVQQRLAQKQAARAVIAGAKS